MFEKIETKTHNVYRFLFLKFKFRKHLNNNIYVVLQNGDRKKVKKIKGLKIRFLGQNSTVLVHFPIINFVNSYIICGDGAIIEIKSSEKMVKELKINATADNVSCFIDEGFSLTKSCCILLHNEPNLKVTIGKDCMFGTNILLRTSDVHTIVDKIHGEIINRGGNVTIGNHVWLAKDVTVLKNVTIVDNCVIGTGSLVTKSLNDKDCIYAGVPAKKIKSDIDWYRESVPEYLEKVMP